MDELRYKLWGRYFQLTGKLLYYRFTYLMGTLALTLSAMVLLSGGIAKIHAQNNGIPLKGSVIEAGTGDAIPGASVQLEERERGVATNVDGQFEFSNVEPGIYTLFIRSVGFTTQTVTVEHPAGDDLVIRMHISVVQEDDIIVTSSPIGRSVRYQPAQALNREELQKRAAPSLGEMLDGSPGLAMRSLGSAPARPVIRGLDGDRVLVLQNGERMGDLSETAVDHAVALDPLALERVEVVRGPASLLYGSSALGGVINMFSHDLPREWSPGNRGALVIHGASVNRMGAGMGQGSYRTDNWAVSGRASYREAGNIRTPDGLLSGTFLDSYNFGGGVGYRNGRLETGAAINYMDYNYGLPEEDDQVMIEMDRFQIQSVTGIELGGFFELAELRFQTNSYFHRELETVRNPDNTATQTVELSFDQNSVSASLLLRHRPVGNLEGAFGISAYYRSIHVGGLKILTPDAQNYFLAAYFYEEFTLSDQLSFQSGLRFEFREMMIGPNEGFVDLTQFQDRSDFIMSGSAGFNFQPSNHWEMGFQIARAFRTPSLEELYSNAPHLHAGVYEVGDATLSNELSLGSDLFIHYRSPVIKAQLSGFVNHIDHFVKFAPAEQVDEASGLPIFKYGSVDASLYGFEFSSLVKFSESISAGLGFDYVRGTEISDSKENLPFIPPFRTFLELNIDKGQWWSGIRLRKVSKQDKVAPGEKITDGYLLLGADAGYRIHDNLSVSFRADNLLNQSYRDHLSRIEDRNNPMPGRNLNAMIRWDF
jgi:iron complex outermembrane recepter protein